MVMLLRMVFRSYNWRYELGKSTLLNILLNEEKAIVSDIAGTTRDVIEDTMTIDGIQFRFIDTAGIRATTDTIENLGIERSFEKIRQASIVLVMIDSRSGYEQIRDSSKKYVTTLKERMLLW
jgi:tRNA modification GTPase